MKEAAWILVLAACGSSGGSNTGDDDVAPDAMIDTPASMACGNGARPPADATWTLMVGNLMRTAKVHLPASYNPSNPAPLVIDSHGLTGSADMQAALSHMIAKSDAAGFIVIHPEGWGSPQSWNAGGGCCGPAFDKNIDDVSFFTALIDEAEAKLCIDPARIYLTGLSNGGYMSQRMGCQLTNRIAAIGPVAGTLSYQQCSPTRALPVFAVHGDADPIVAYSNATQTDQYWAAKNKCTTTQTTYQNGDATCVTHRGCTDGADVTLCTIAGGGHQWPGGDELPFLGKKSNDLIATDAIWEFFAAHPL